MPRALRILAAVVLLGWTWLWVGLPAAGFVVGARRAPVVDRTLAGVPVTVVDGRRTWGAAYREELPGMIHLHLAGSPAEIGWGLGVLTGDRIATLEGDLMGVFAERVPTWPLRHLVLGLVSGNNRSLDGFLTAAERTEIAASSAAYAAHHDPFACLGPAYGRSVQYHALHDVSQYLIDSPLVHPIAVGCTGIVVGPSRAGGRLLAGRLFDFEGGPRFDHEKIVTTVAPDRGHAYVSVAWAGMTGAVTGLNAPGLWVAINAAATDDPVVQGRPMVLLVRELLQHAATIDEAVAIIARTPVFVSDAIQLASRIDGRAVVVEKGPHGMGVRGLDADRLVVANHFLDPAWSADRANADRMRRGTTTRRAARATALIDAESVHTPTTIARILRDRRTVDGRDVGFGNRGTINAWIGCHLAVCDVTAGLLWVSAPPHGLGELRPFTPHGPATDAPRIAADPEADRATTDLPAYQADRRALTALLAAGLTPAAQARAQALAAALLARNPGAWEALHLAGRAAADPAERRRLFTAALAAAPAYPGDAAAIAADLAGTTP
jgi:hypothetical protein